MANMFPFKSYCWSIGTTSYRTKHFNLSIERQIMLMDKFKSLNNKVGANWQNQQVDYYYFLRDEGFLTGDAKRPDKDAREKTSGLVNIGLLDADRNLTSVGLELLNMCKLNDFSPDNFLEISKDSFLYMKQLLKTTVNVGGNIIRPFIVFAYLESRLGYLTNEEFMYFLPLCLDLKTTKLVETKILEHRDSENIIDNSLIDVIMSMQNYQDALKYFLSSTVSESVICNIGINRKSWTYDRCYYPFYLELKSVILEHKTDLLPLYETIKNIRGKSKNLWATYLFKTLNKNSIKKNGVNHLKDSDIINSQDEYEFKSIFFKTMHLFKMKSTLHDYMDLNRRYFKTTETVIFADGKVEFDIIPKCYFGNISDRLLTIAFTGCDNLSKNIQLEQISPIFDVNISKLYEQLGDKFGKTITTPQEAKNIAKDERYIRFNKLIDEKFSNEAIINLLDKFENRDDNYLSKYITDNASPSTMFEYILGIAWYKISDRQGDILDYMNLSLEADLLPKTHAGGGQADIVYLYNKTMYYPEHTVLIEATLAEYTGQRVLEMESVTRHIGDYGLKNKDKESYCIFISTKLLLNLISDFRGRKSMLYFSSNGEDFIDRTKIIPLGTTELKSILKNNISYKEIYALFEDAYQSDIGVTDWYNETICNKLC